MKPLVSCLMPTYGRVPKSKHLIEESIESFLKQDYENKELIILNDCPGQYLFIDHPRIVIINSNRRFRTLGEKYNAMAALSSGDLLCTWEDDDICLPWRLTYSINKLGNGDYWTGVGYWFWNGKLHYNHPIGICHNQSVYTRDIFNKIRGYRHISFGADKYIEIDFSSAGIKVKKEKIGVEEWYYIYRWRTGSFHGSGSRNMYEKLENNSYPEGEYELIPTWKEDYVENIRRQIKLAKAAKQI